MEYPHLYGHHPGGREGASGRDIQPRGAEPRAGELRLAGVSGEGDSEIKDTGRAIGYDIIGKFASAQEAAHAQYINSVKHARERQ